MASNCSSARNRGAYCRASEYSEDNSSKLLKSKGAMTAKRLAALVGLRDIARRVLQSQNEGWPESHRNEARGDARPR